MVLPTPSHTPRPTVAVQPGGRLKPTRLAELPAELPGLYLAAAEEGGRGIFRKILFLDVGITSRMPGSPPSAGGRGESQGA